MGRHYSESALKAVGAACGDKLPPASAMQAMFLYEMKRETEIESLFQGQLFRLAKAEDEAKGQQLRISKMEEEMKSLNIQATRKDMNDRLATSKVRMDALQSKLTTNMQSVETNRQRLDAMEFKIKRIDGRSSEMSTSLSADLMKNCEELASQSTILKTCREDITGLDNDISILFDERDALVAQLQQANQRIEKLEGLVRALTAQNSTTGSTTTFTTISPTNTQLLPVQTNNGQSLNLSVPKGNGFTGQKENHRPIRDFTPGKSSWPATEG